MSERNPVASLPLWQTNVTFHPNGSRTTDSRDPRLRPYHVEYGILLPAVPYTCWSCGAGNEAEGWTCWKCGKTRRLTPTAKGKAGADDGLRHAKQEAPAFVLEALGDALFSFRGTEFTSDHVRAVAERSEAVAGWLNGPTRNACFSGWWRSRIRLHKLVRVNRPPAAAQRASRRGSCLPYWTFPTL